MPDWLRRLDTVRQLLTVSGRTLVQGALGYLLALDPSIIPLPGIRTEPQARENASVLTIGPLPQAETAEITALPRRLSGAEMTESWRVWRDQRKEFRQPLMDPGSKWFESADPSSRPMSFRAGDCHFVESHS